MAIDTTANLSIQIGSGVSSIERGARRIKSIDISTNPHTTVFVAIKTNADAVVLNTDTCVIGDGFQIGGVMCESSRCCPRIC
ncbi:MAG: hypothetical protein J07HQW2_02440 [Haloquadratum walsbyi J07HQW2]|uniref:Uncharacterized protein n=1 Tax=Haloquadratum walsbyi J07HQW2 TaxID=1238425 RepID=U1MZN8_9EURY|nr:MAG: hypothetical protein J07HQW2_02440 [Haloquadratum walsbyi J07HQW2]